MGQTQEEQWANDDTMSGGKPNTDYGVTAAAPGKGAPQTMVQDGQVFQWIPAVDPITGEILETGSWERIATAKDPSDAGGGGQPRNDALTAAQAALAGFLQAQTLADARKLAAMENMQKLGQWAVPDGAQHAPNFEPGGLANTAYAVAGMKNFTPPPLQTRRVNPNDVAGDIPPEIRQMIGAVRAAGGA
jgi:hypothetical protein